ncbi:hypothetical protein K461DRAFT_300610 [Myriangium duriaei CBS 260.36]|uniref:Uncharacterized protein n=1 Tax=Myriangium duriaei CBS 260.36 TaxID=1168546 RepID=A0A9P4IV12_9PEZI|nr:hypothetical protein K461DRAFT_300610 [Myriangium duriaei CBS 260.36]
MRSFLLLLPVGCLAIAPPQHLICPTETITLPPITITQNLLVPQGAYGLDQYVLTETRTGASGQRVVYTETVTCPPTEVGSCLLSGWTSIPRSGLTSGTTTIPTAKATQTASPKSGTSYSKHGGDQEESGQGSSQDDGGQDIDQDQGAGSSNSGSTTASPGGRSQGHNVAASSTFASSTAAPTPNIYTGPEYTGGAAVQFSHGVPTPALALLIMAMALV